MRRCSGIWPPSNPRRREYPRRDFCPLSPEPEVLPSLEPIPRPTRTLRCREPRGGRRFDRLARVSGREADLLAGLRRLLVFFLVFRPLEKFFCLFPFSPLPPKGAIFGSCPP